MMSKLTTRSDEISEKLSYYKSNAAECVSQKVSEMDVEYSSLLSEYNGVDKND